MPPSTINPQYIINMFFPSYLPHKLDIGHIRMYELLHDVSIWSVYHHYTYLNQYMNEVIDEMRVLYETLVHNWSDYERFVESELPFMRWKKSNKIFY